MSREICIVVWMIRQLMFKPSVSVPFAELGYGKGYLRMLSGTFAK
jgi:hypothetical protein